MVAVPEILRDYILILRSRNIGIFISSSCILSFMGGPLRWLLPILLLESGGPLFLGFAFAIANIDDTVMAFIGGVLADRYGRKKVLLFSRLMYVHGACLLLLSMLVGGTIGRGAVFAAVFFLYGMTGVSSGPGPALLAESIEPHYTGRAFSLLNSSSLVFRSLGSAALGIIYQRSSLSAAWVIVLASSISTLLIFGIRETRRTEVAQTEESVGAHFVNTFRRIGQLGTLGLIPLILLVVGNGLGHGVCGYYFAPFLEEFHAISPAMLGGVFSMIPVFQALLMFLAGWLVDRGGPFLSLVIGNVVAGAWVLLLGMVKSTGLAMTATVLSGALGAFHGIGYETVVAKLSDERMRATLFGTLTALWNTMFIVGPVVGGALYGIHQPLPFIAAGTILLATLLPMCLLKSSR
jgi:MFS family permease